MLFIFMNGVGKFMCGKAESIYRIIPEKNAKKKDLITLKLKQVTCIPDMFSNR